MTVMLWWVPPLLATLIAIGWVSWRARSSERHPDDTRTPKELDKMARALSKPVKRRTDDLT
ncbi:MAG: hypothetical protein WCP28_14590 [Actinomycetes bacterium]